MRQLKLDEGGGWETTLSFGVALFKFGMWTPLPSRHFCSKFGFNRIRDHGVAGKGRYGRTRTWTWTRIVLKYTFTFTKQLFFIPNIVFTAAFTSRPKRRSCHSAYPYISACTKDRLAP